MYFHRLAQYLKNHDWTALFLEFLIVVVGVFIAIQADSWNKTRIDRQDESSFLTRLHDDLELALNLSERVRSSRLERRDLLISASEVLFGRNNRILLTQQECLAIAASHHMGITIAEFTSFNEIVDSGRLNIISNDELRGLLASYDQLVTASRRFLSSNRNNLLRLFPDLVEVDVASDTDFGVNWDARCSVENMKLNRKFLNLLTENTDIYDAFVGDALAPWDLHLKRIHRIVDKELDLSHQ